MSSVWVKVSSRFSVSMVYFDHNATSPLSPEARQAWLETCEKFPGNPSSPHRLGSRAEVVLAQAREEIAALLQTAPDNLVWTSGATESNNTVIRHFQAADPQREIWVSAIEHPCLREAARHCFPGTVREIPVLRSGVVDLTWVESALKTGRPALICLMAANNETGVLQPFREAARLCRQYGVYLLVDAVQWAGKVPAGELAEIDFLSISGHKFGGPRGIGLLKIPAGLSLRPLLYGGSQEEARRAGTENVPGAVAMAAAWRAREEAIWNGCEERMRWREAFEAGLRSALPETEIVGRDQPRLWNTASALMPAIGEQERWVVKLDKRGFAVSTGSACASGKETPSHVLTAMGHGAERASRALRFSSGWETTEEEWEGLLAAVKEVGAGASSG